MAKEIREIYSAEDLLNLKEGNLIVRGGITPEKEVISNPIELVISIFNRQEFLKGNIDALIIKTIRKSKDLSDYVLEFTYTVGRHTNPLSPQISLSNNSTLLAKLNQAGF